MTWSTLLEHHLSNQSLFLISHRVTLITGSWTFFLNPSIHPNKPGSFIVPCVDLGSWHKMVLNPLWFPGALSRHRFSNRKGVPSLWGVVLWIQTHFVVLSSLRPSCHCPRHPSLFYPAVLQVHLAEAFYSELYRQALPYVIPVLSLLLPSGFCLLFLNFLPPWRQAEKGKDLLYKIKVLLEWTLSHIF